MKQLIEIEVDIPEGYKFSRFGKMKAGDVYTSSEGKPYTYTGEITDTDFVIIEKCVTYREPDARDVGKPCEVKLHDTWRSGYSYIGRTAAGSFVTETRVIQCKSGAKLVWLMVRLA